MRKRVFTVTAVLAVLMTFLISYLAITRINNTALQNIKQTLLTNAKIVASQGRENEMRAASDVVYQSSGMPVTLIQKDGAVLYRCPANAGAEENHLQREEVQQALKTGQGVATRYSTTLGKNMCYIAVTTGDGAYIVRLGQQMDTVNAANRQMALEIILLSGICLAGLLVLDWRMTSLVTAPINEMTAVARAYADGHYGQKL